MTCQEDEIQNIKEDILYLKSQIGCINLELNLIFKVLKKRNIINDSDTKTITK